MNSAYIILGGNLGDKRKNLETAQRFVNLEIGKIKRQSGIYETEPWGFEDSKNFFKIYILNGRCQAVYGSINPK